MTRTERELLLLLAKWLDRSYAPPQAIEEARAKMRELVREIEYQQELGDTVRDIVNPKMAADMEPASGNQPPSNVGPNFTFKVSS